MPHNGHVHLEMPAPAPIEASAGEPIHLEIPAPPKLQHLGSDRSDTSMYSLDLNTRIPPAYEEAVEEQEPR